VRMRDEILKLQSEKIELKPRPMSGLPPKKTKAALKTGKEQVTKKLK